MMNHYLMIFHRRVYDANSARNTTRDHARTHNLPATGETAVTYEGRVGGLRGHTYAIPPPLLYVKHHSTFALVGNVVCIIQKHITRACVQYNNNIHRVYAREHTHKTTQHNRTFMSYIQYNICGCACVRIIM